MSGSSSIPILPAYATFSTPASGLIRQTLPLTPGYPDGTPVATGVAPPNSLFSLSPPTLLEQFEVYALSIAWGVQLSAAPAVGTPINVELQLLRNGEIVSSQSSSGGTLDKVGGGAWNADLVNPLKIGARERLGLQVLLSAGVGAAMTGTFMISAQAGDGASMNAASNWSTIQGSISYNVIDLPASRRL